MNIIKAMWVRYATFYVLIVLSTVLFWYYSLNFGSIYKMTSYGWIHSSIICIVILDWFGFSLLIALLIGTIREVTRRYPNRYDFYNFRWVLIVTNAMFVPVRYILA